MQQTTLPLTNVFTYMHECIQHNLHISKKLLYIFSYESIPLVAFFPETESASALIQLPNVLSDLLIDELSFNLSPVAPVESALSL